MKEATGQAGVSIALDDVTLYQSIGKTVYRDTDGLTGASDAAGVFITGAETLTTIRAIFDGAGNRGGFLAKDYHAIAKEFNYDSVIEPDDTNGDPVNDHTFESKALTIDVANKAKLLTAGKLYNLDAYVGQYDMATLATELNHKGMKRIFNAAKLGNAEAIAILESKGVAAPGTAETYATWIAKDATVPDGNGGTTTMAYANIVTAIALGKAGYDATAGQTFGDYAVDLVDNDSLAVAGVVIGLPTIEIRKTGSMKSIGVTSDATWNDGAGTGSHTYNANDSFITIKKSDSVLAILNGVIEIAPHP
jgi:hypothetical protein